MTEVTKKGTEGVGRSQPVSKVETSSLWPKQNIATDGSDLCNGRNLKAEKPKWGPSTADETEFIANIHSYVESRRGLTDDNYSAEEVVNFDNKFDFLSLFKYDEELSGDQYQRYTDILWEFKDIISRHDYDVGLTPAMEAEINTVDNFVNIFKYQVNRFYSLEAKKVIDSWDQQLTNGDIIEESKSPIGFPVLVVKRTGKKSRVVVDFKELNKHIIQPDTPYCSMKESFDSFKNKKVFSCIDLTMAFYSIPIKESDRWKVAVKTHNKLIQMKRLPMGLSISPREMMKVAFKVIDGYDEFLTSYIDDIAVSSVSFDEHLIHFRRMLERLRRYNLKVKPSKCQLFQRQIKFLGHMVSANGLEIPKDRIVAITAVQTPTSVRSLRSFIGIANFSRDYIECIDKYLGPLHELTQKGVKFEWTDRHQECFESLKKKLTTAPCLAFADDKLQKILQTDASDKSVGGMLGQVNNNKIQVIAYFNKRLTPSQEKWSTIEKELLAIMVVVKNYHKHLIDRKFVIYTDHQPLMVLNSRRSPRNQRLYRWGIELSMYDFDIYYNKGENHVIADCLSRLEYSRNEQMKKKPKVIAVESSELVKALDYTKLKDEESDDDKSDNNSVKEDFDSDDVIAVLNLEGDELTADLDNDIETYQNEDPYCIALKNVLTDRNKEFPMILKWFRLHNNIVYKKKRRNQKQPNTLRVVVPQKLIPRLMQVVHDDEGTGGHLGIHKSEQKIVNRYFFQNIREHVKTHIRQCERCARTKQINHKTYGVPQIIGTPVQPFDAINMDLCGPLAVSDSGNKYFIVICDRLSRYIVAKAVLNKNAECFLKALQEFITDYNAPSKLITDKDRAFESRLFQEYIQGMAINHHKTASFYAASDGLAEVSNRKVLNGLRKYCNENSRNWDLNLKLVTKSINCSVNETTTFTPFYLLFGFDPMNAFERKLKIKLLEEYPSVDSEDQTVSTTDITLEGAREEARQRILLAEAKWVEFRSRHMTRPTFKIGDCVLMTDKSIDIKNRNPKKLRELRTGPYIIVREPTAGTFRSTESPTEEQLSKGDICGQQPYACPILWT